MPATASAIIQIDVHLGAAQYGNTNPLVDAHRTLIAWVEELSGHNEIVRFLTTNLNEEKAANTKLNTVALSLDERWCSGH